MGQGSNGGSCYPGAEDVESRQGECEDQEMVTKGCRLEELSEKDRVKVTELGARLSFLRRTCGVQGCS